MRSLPTVMPHLLKHYALSIALQTLTGYNTGNYANLPGMLVTATNNVHITGIKSNRIFYTYSVGGKMMGAVSAGNNTHFLNKDELLVALDNWKYEKS